MTALVLAERLAFVTASHENVRDDTPAGQALTPAR